MGRGGKGVGDYFAYCGRAPGTAVHVGKAFYLSARLVFDTFAAARVKSSEFLDLVWQEWGEPTWLVRLGMPPTLRRTFLLWRSSCGESKYGIVFLSSMRPSWSSDFSYYATNYISSMQITMVLYVLHEAFLVNLLISHIMRLVMFLQETLTF